MLPTFTGATEAPCCLQENPALASEFAVTVIKVFVELALANEAFPLTKDHPVKIYPEAGKALILVEVPLVNVVPPSAVPWLVFELETLSVTSLSLSVALTMTVAIPLAVRLKVALPLAVSPS
jgi:hypothetical protein